MSLIGVLDFESTGVDPLEDRIVEVALVVWDTEQRKERLAFERRVNPERPIPAGAVRIHGITDADVMRAQSFKAIAPALVKLVGMLDLLVGHNIERFDAVLLAAECHRVGLPLASAPPVFDTMLQGRWATADGKIPTLGELCFALDVPYDPEQAHGALYDVRVNLQAYLRAVEIGVWDLPAPSMKEAA